jgi:hypothetical protein
MKLAKDAERKSWIELPDTADVTPAMFNSISEAQKKNKLKKDATGWQVSIRDAKLCALFVSQYGDWNMPEYETVEAFMEYLDGEPTTVQYVAWFANVYTRYIRDLLDPNAFAVTS